MALLLTLGMVTTTATAGASIKLDLRDGTTLSSSSDASNANNVGAFTWNIDSGKVTYDPDSRIMKFTGNPTIQSITVQHVDLTITGSVTCTTDSGSAILCPNENLTLKDAEISATSTAGVGIWVEGNGNLNIENSKVTVKGKTYGIWCAGKLTVSGGTVSATGTNNYGIRAEGLEISDGTVTAAGKSCGLFSNNNHPISIKDSNVTASCDNPGDFGAIYASGGGNSITLTGVTITKPADGEVTSVTAGCKITSGGANASKVVIEPEGGAASDGGYMDATGTKNPTLYQGSGSVTPFTVKHSNEQQDTETFDAFDGIKMDQETQFVAKENYTAVKGSVVITLKPAYLDTLALGSHVLHVYLKPDSVVDIPFTLKASTASAGMTDVNAYAPDAPQKVWKFPKTGDSSPLGLWIAMTVFGAAGVAALALTHKRKK